MYRLNDCPSRRFSKREVSVRAGLSVHAPALNVHSGMPETTELVTNGTAFVPGPQRASASSVRERIPTSPIAALPPP
ncbi:hypothetical protein B0H19DRAFT_1182820 [Mycena capillaripes]|nr:hypothetical protein B0H19DRAFT_1182820 [Mycena capillaripes]